MNGDPQFNDLGQAIGCSLAHWRPPAHLAVESMDGRWCRVEKLDPKLHGSSLFDANMLDVEGSIWTYLPYGPFSSLAEYRAWISDRCCGSDPSFFAIIDKKIDRAVGMASYLNIRPADGVVEVGNIVYSPLLKRSTAATEAMFLMMERAFESGFRRYEWKCDVLNTPSSAAAKRLGFSFEGVFRQGTVYKRRNRDTAWLSVIDSEWPALRDGFQCWLQPANFDKDGRQLQSLADLFSARKQAKRPTACHR